MHIDFIYQYYSTVLSTVDLMMLITHVCTTTYMYIYTLVMIKLMCKCTVLRSKLTHAINFAILHVYIYIYIYIYI